MNRKNVGILLFAWDSLWKTIAVLVAVRNRQFKWVGPLVAVNSLGILPMVYLWKFAGPRLDESDEDEGEEWEPQAA